MYKGNLSLLPCRVRPLYRTQSLHLPVHSMTHTVLITAMKETHCVIRARLPRAAYESRVVHSHYLISSNTGHTQKNGAVSIGIPIETAPFFCVYPVH
jgi:hypothetical protein